MKLQIVLATLVAAAAAAPQFTQDINPFQDFGNQPQFVGSVGQPEIRIISQRFEQDPQGNYEYAYEQDNGQKVEEVGRVQPGSVPETGSLTQQGNFQYVGDDGNTYQVSYVADENGFQPQAAHLPVAPAQIPEYAQLRQEHPELFWAETGILPNGLTFSGDNQQFVGTPQFIDGQQFISGDQQQFVSDGTSFF